MLTLFLIGCGGTRFTVQEKEVSYPVECGTEPKWSYVNLEDVIPFAIKNAAGDPGVHFTMDEYKSLGLLASSFKLFETEANAVVEFYVDCIDDHNARATEKIAEEKAKEEADNAPAWQFWK